MALVNNGEAAGADPDEDRNDHSPHQRSKSLDFELAC